MNRDTLATGGNQGRGDPPRIRRATRRVHLVDLVDVLACLGRDLVALCVWTVGALWLASIAAVLLRGLVG